jgi:hypothetical protein
MVVAVNSTSRPRAVLAVASLDPVEVVVDGHTTSQGRLQLRQEDEEHLEAEEDVIEETGQHPSRPKSWTRSWKLIWAE